MLPRYRDALLESAAFAGDQLLAWTPTWAGTTWPAPPTASLPAGAGLPRLDTSRLRATWQAETAAMIGLPAFLHVAGISCCQRLGDITAGLDPGGE